MTFHDSDSSNVTGTVNCWTISEPATRNNSLNYSQNQNDVQQLFNAPVIEYFNHIGDRLVVSSTCGEWYETQ